MTEVTESNVLTAERILNDPAASFWLKQALADALKRDPVDAASDAFILSTVLQNRADGLFVPTHQTSNNTH